MLRPLSILFTLVIALNTFSLSVIQLSFELNRDYIAEFLCIEREKEITICRGSCFLDDKLKQAEDQQEQNQIPSVTIAVFYIPQFWETDFTVPELLPISFSLFQEKLSTLLSADLFFHPPRT